MSFVVSTVSKTRMFRACSASKPPIAELGHQIDSRPYLRSYAYPSRTPLYLFKFSTFRYGDFCGSCAQNVNIRSLTWQRNAVSVNGHVDKTPCQWNDLLADCKPVVTYLTSTAHACNSLTGAVHDGGVIKGHPAVPSSVYVR
jgi:hypothetical protein